MFEHIISKPKIKKHVFSNIINQRKVFETFIKTWGIAVNGVLGSAIFGIVATVWLKLNALSSLAISSILAAGFCMWQFVKVKNDLTTSKLKLALAKNDYVQFAAISAPYPFDQHITVEESAYIAGIIVNNISAVPIENLEVRVSNIRIIKNNVYCPTGFVGPRRLKINSNTKNIFNPNTPEYIKVLYIDEIHRRVKFNFDDTEENNMAYSHVFHKAEVYRIDIEASGKNNGVSEKISLRFDHQGNGQRQITALNIEVIESEDFIHSSLVSIPSALPIVLPETSRQS